MSRFDVDALAFDAYGTLFDVHSVTALAESMLPGHGARLSALWRTKQLEYSWLTSLMVQGSRATAHFGEVTRQALAYALEALDLPLADASRHRLLDAYQDLTPFVDAQPALEALRPRPCWILSNGSEAMLGSLVERSGLAPYLAGVLSAQRAGIFKPSPRVYQLAVDALGVAPARIGFVSSNGWDAAGAKAFGFTVFWINRNAAAPERHGPAPDHVLAALTDLPPVLRPSPSLGTSPRPT